MKPAAVLAALSIRPLGRLSPSEQSEILRIRNQEGVRNNMYTSHKISEDEHARWLHGMSKREDTRFFAVMMDGEVVGGISLNGLDPENRKAEWAFYLDEATQGQGIGSGLEFMFLDYAFGEVGLEKLNCEVLAFNAPVIKMHKRFGFVEEGVRRNHIVRDGEAIDAVLLGITRNEWDEKRTELQKGLFRNAA